MTKDEFNVYKLEVYAKTNGSDVHDIGGKLGLISTIISLRDKNHSDYNDDYCKEYIAKIRNEIKKKLNGKI